MRDLDRVIEQWKGTHLPSSGKYAWGEKRIGRRRENFGAIVQYPSADTLYARTGPENAPFAVLYREALVNGRSNILHRAIVEMDGTVHFHGSMKEGDKGIRVQFEPGRFRQGDLAAFHEEATKLALLMRKYLKTG